jgi:hypothetical protein
MVELVGENIVAVPSNYFKCLLSALFIFYEPWGDINHMQGMWHRYVEITVFVHYYFQF